MKQQVMRYCATCAGTRLPLLLIIVFAVLCLTQTDPLYAAQKAGKISGKILDAETGEPLPGAVVQIKLESSTIGAQTDFDGNYLIREVPVGIHALEIFLAGYRNTVVREVRVNSEEVTNVPLALHAEAYEDEEQVVEARVLPNNEAVLLMERQKAPEIGNAISAEAMSNSGASDAGEAIAKIAGGTMQGGKYANLRGLEERYISTHLNGTELASADPDKKAFHMDLIPTNLLDNVQVIKSFTPDRPGNFSGGIIDIGTKTYPEQLSLKFSVSSTYSSGASYNDNFLTYRGGNDDWLGFDDGTRDVPDPVSGTELPLYSYTINSPETAHSLSELTRSFNSVMSPISKAPPLNSDYSFSLGNQTTLFGKRLGYQGSFNYGRKYNYYDGGRLAYYFVSGDPSVIEGLTNDWRMSDARGSEEVLWGGLFATSYHIHPNHEFGADYVHTQSGENMARYISGHFYDGNLSPEATYETRVLRYTERTLNSLQFHGKHYLPGLFRSNLDWNYSYSRNEQDEPDMRFFSNHFYVDEESGDTSYYIAPNLYTLPQRYYRELDENSSSFDINWSIPFKQWNGQSSKFKFGGLFSQKNRDFLERVYNFKNPANKYEYNGDPSEFFSPENLGIIDSTFNPYSQTWRYDWTLYVYDNSDPRANYTGDESISAFYGLLDIPLSTRLRVIAGARFETTGIEVAPVDTSYESGSIDTDDLLPSVNLTYALNKKMNLRAAYGRTLARPTFREMAPYPSWDFANEFYFIGNPELMRTLIDNFDVRWEYFIRPGELLALSLFYKDFQNPIERAIKHENGEIQYQNVDQATVYGIEFEIRKNLDVLTGWLRNFTITSNLTLINSQVDIPETELDIIRSYDPDADDTRPLQGQSPYILNIDLTYDNHRTGTMANLSFNVFGERLYEVSQGATPDVYEQSRPDLKLILKQGLFGGIDLRLKFSNILNPSYKNVHHFRGDDYIRMEHKEGRRFSIGLSYSI
ncbi:MAG TPA: TonB-dependent receptor [candidate division Zixibacteria bacterium]|nr:TonB-dependent receptor [candidate division Zixibacteria bacterium]